MPDDVVTKNSARDLCIYRAILKGSTHRTQAMIYHISNSMVEVIFNKTKNKRYKEKEIKKLDKLIKKNNNNYLKMEIISLGINQVTIKALNDLGVYTINDVSKYSEIDLIKIPSINRTNRDLILNKLKILNFN